MKAWVKWLCGVFAFLILCALCLVGVLYYESELRIQTIDENVSHDGNYTVVLQQVGEPNWPFGAVKARIVFEQNGSTISKYDTQISNDGGNLWTGSWIVSWKVDSVEVILMGSEQEPETLIFEFCE